MAMATSNQPLPGLHVTAPEEDMEISDYERNADDIDIDIDLTVDPSHHEDENMDDDRSEHDTRDDIMLDGDGNDDEDGMMQDNVSVPDEHLTDASDVGYVDVEAKDAPQNENAPEHVDVEVQDSTQAEDYIDYDDAVEPQPQAAPAPATQQTPVPPVANQDQLQEGDVQTAQASAVQAQTLEVDPVSQQTAQEQAPVSVEQQVQEPTSADLQIQEPTTVQGGAELSTEEYQDFEKPAEPNSEAASAQPIVETQAAAVTEEPAHNAVEAAASRDQDGSSAYAGQHAESATAQEVPEVPEQKKEPEQSGQQSEEALDFSLLPFDSKPDDENQSSHSGSPLHPVVVVYQGDEISLFPPDDGDTSDSFYFLQDESLADESVKVLLQACRQVLGETMRDEDELEIDVAELGLCVSEDSEHAANTSFAQILDVYLRLHQLDGNENPGPLYLTLNTKTRFSVRLDSLLAAIADGRGMSQLSFLEDGTEEETYIEAEIAQEQGSASQTDEHQQEVLQHSGHEHDSALENTQTEEPHISLKSDEKQEQDARATAVQAVEDQAEERQSAANEEQSARQQPEEPLTATQEQQETQEYLAGTSPAPEDLPEYESSDEENVPQEKEDERDIEDGSRTDAQNSRDNDQIDYDDGDNAEDTKDDASYRSSTLQGDNTPATFDESTSQVDHPSGVPTDTSGVAVTSIAAKPQDESFNVEDHDSSAAVQEDLPAPEDAEAETFNFDANAGEEHESEHHVTEQDFNKAEEEALEQELERELNNQGDSFDLPHDYPDVPDGDQYSTNYGDGEEYGYEQEGDGQETLVGEETYEDYVVVGADDVQQSTGAPDVGPHDDQKSSHDYGFDDAVAEQTAEDHQDGTESGFDEQLQHGAPEQAQPTDHASEEDELDTIDYDDEELSQHNSPQPDGAAVQSPSSAKRGWEELGQDDDDQANEQAPKKVKSE